MREPNDALVIDGDDLAPRVEEFKRDGEESPVLPKLFGSRSSEHYKMKGIV
jgi:hypothetical protein